MDGQRCNCWDKLGDVRRKRKSDSARSQIWILDGGVDAATKAKAGSTGYPRATGRPGMLGTPLKSLGRLGTPLGIPDDVNPGFAWPVTGPGVGKGKPGKSGALGNPGESGGTPEKGGMLSVGRVGNPRVPGPPETPGEIPFGGASRLGNPTGGVGIPGPSGTPGGKLFGGVGRLGNVGFPGKPTGSVSGTPGNPGTPGGKAFGSVGRLDNPGIPGNFWTPGNAWRKSIRRRWQQTR